MAIIVGTGLVRSRRVAQELKKYRDTVEGQDADRGRVPTVRQRATAQSILDGHSDQDRERATGKRVWFVL